MSVATGAPRAEPRIRLTRVDWETFERLAATARGGRFAYDRGVLEIMSPGPLHESDDLTPTKIAAANAARERGSNDSVESPAPDLALEVDIGEPEVDRPSIDATIGADEIWRLVDEEVRIEHLGEDATYTRAESSRFLPVRAIDIQRWLTREDRSDAAAWEGCLTAWARRIARPRHPRRRPPADG